MKKVRKTGKIEISIKQISVIFIYGYQSGESFFFITIYNILIKTKIKYNSLLKLKRLKEKKQQVQQ